MCQTCGCELSNANAATLSDTDESEARLREVVSGARWGSDVLGRPGGVVTWSIAPAGTILTAPNFLSELDRSIDGQSAYPFDIEVALREAFAFWTEAADIEFVQIPDGGGDFSFGQTADIRIAFNEINDDFIGVAQFPVADSFRPFPGDGAAGNIVLDPTIADLAEDRGLTERELFVSLATHEIGHAAIGLNHSPLETSIMQPTIRRMPGIDPEDAAAAEQVYGPQDDATPVLRLSDLGETDFVALHGPEGLVIEGTDGPDRIESAAGAETLSGGGGDDTLIAGAGDDRLIGGPGADSLDGGAGLDTAAFPGAYDPARLDITLEAVTVSGADGPDTLVDIERIAFEDGLFALAGDDTELGFAFRLYRAAFGREADEGVLFWQAARLAGTSPGAIAEAFVQSEEFETLYGAPDPAGFVGLLYENVLGRSADEAGLAFWTAQLEAGAGRADLLLAFSESDENRAATDPLLGDGLFF
ncbi:MAG: DUF4214 domain-containing protein [Pseudomonadota bacterium]